ncbi:MAG TPA: nitrile hydratase subunit alpha [Chloroflexota bacterium]
MSHNPEPQPYAALRAQAIESLLVEKGLISTDAVDALVDLYERDIGPLRGARVVARAWTDPAFKARLLADANAACAELEPPIEGLRTRLIVLENTPTVHNMVVCTLCSCYPWAVLGLPPSWYKAAPYRSRAVLEPRAVLSEFGVELAPEVDVRVWDSSSETRYMVLPQRPPGTDHLSEDELAGLVTRDAMIGVAQVAAPTAAQAA